MAAASVALLLAGLLVPPPAQGVTRRQVGHQAATYAKQRGYHVGIAVLDTKTGELRGSGLSRSTFASESVVKTFIASRLLASGQMYGTTERMAWKMITRSDDNMASALYGRVGGDALIYWVKRYFHVADLGTPPRRSGWWGNTHITPEGLVKFYAKVKRNHRIGPWLLKAMHHATEYGSDGQYQYFGLPSATSRPAVKQGWGCDYDDWGDSADFNTTGFVNSDRYAVAVLARGPISTYGSRISALLTRAARRLLPDGRYPPPVPAITTMSRHTGAITGGQVVTVRGRYLTRLTAVTFGSVPAAKVEHVSSTLLRATTPAHRATALHLHVLTSHGATATDAVSAFQFGPVPTVQSVAPNTGPPSGGTRVTLTGAHLVDVVRVMFGKVAGTGLVAESATTLTVVAPPQDGGVVDVRVLTGYGASRPVMADRFTYVAVSPTPHVTTPAAPAPSTSEPAQLTPSPASS